MKLNRRGLLGTAISGALAGPSIVQEVMTPVGAGAIGALDKASGYGAKFNEGIEAGEKGRYIERRFKEVQAKLAAWARGDIPEDELRDASRYADPNSLEPGITCLASMSMTAKVRMQRDANVRRALEECRLQYEKEYEYLRRALGPLGTFAVGLVDGKQ